MSGFHESLRYDGYDLNAKSIVLDLGAYHGNFSKILSSKYPCKIHAFEPVPEFYAIACDALSGNTNVTIYNHAVGASDMDVMISVAGDRSGAFEDNGDRIVCKQIGIESILNYQCEGSTVDLMKVNIEGGEFDLLDFILDAGLQYKFKAIQVQPHDLVLHASQRWDEIDRRLKESHGLKWSFPWCWSSYQLK